MSDAPQNPQPPMPPTPPSAAHNHEKLMNVLCYLGILVLIPVFVVQKKSPTLLLNVQQGLILAAVELVLSLLPWWSSWDMLQVVPILVSIYAIIQVVQDRTWEIPLIGEYAKKIKL